MHSLKDRNYSKSKNEKVELFYQGKTLNSNLKILHNEDFSPEGLKGETDLCCRCQPREGICNICLITGL
jgi:hypothetical protein